MVGSQLGDIVDQGHFREFGSFGRGLERRLRYARPRGRRSWEGWEIWGWLRLAGFVACDVVRGWQGPEIDKVKFDLIDSIDLLGFRNKLNFLVFSVTLAVARELVVLILF